MKQRRGEELEEEPMWVSAAGQKWPLHQQCLQLYVFIREEMHSYNCWLLKQRHMSNFMVT